MPKVAYFDCLSGISGDMTLGALVDAGVELAKLNDAVGSLGLPGCRLVAEPVTKKGFRATQVTVKYEPEHAHRHLRHILNMIDGGRLTQRQKELARRIFTKLAEAEAKVHGTSIEKVHFHEVGAADSIADVVGSAVGLDLLGIDRIVASPVPTGSGTVNIAHGTCSIPAPATAELLRGIPLAESSVRCELTTPTGAAILAALADAFGPLPAMTVEQIGCGAGQRDLDEQPNLLRLLVGRTTSATDATDRVCVLETNLDDISGEMIGYCTTRLWDAGALDVYTTAIQMKKNRPGVKLSVLCREGDVEPIEAVLFTETTTLGVRRWTVGRHVLSRQPHSVATDWGPIEGKVGWLSDGTPRFAPEFESCRHVAAEHDVPLRTVYETAQRAFDPSKVDRPVE
ncbi:MAG: nickel pincer cofactor biosynthesis protein LarC [Candidatus Nealsonbacteria bacterium]|nr:nickel pincer cofactor biosynthesis protein LarC [Candidatus Nealsonbacteria bacterium]